jgi:hypothetical protein
MKCLSLGIAAADAAASEAFPKLRLGITYDQALLATVSARLYVMVLV